MNNKGFAPVLIIVLIGAVVLALAGYSFIQKSSPLTQNLTSSPTPQALIKYSEKQLNMIAHKEEIKQKLNLTEAQFEAVLLMSADSDFSYIPER